MVNRRTDTQGDGCASHTRPPRFLGRQLAICSVLLIATLDAPLAADPPETQRLEAVALAGEGQLDEGLERLQALDARHPDRPRILADLIILWRQAGENDAIVRRTTGLRPTDVPDYAHVSWAGALRDAGQFERAALVLDASRHRLGTSARVLHGVVLAESGDTPAAITALETIDPLPDSAEDLALMAYGMRLAGRPRDGLALANRARDLDPDHRLARQEQLLALWQLGAAERALAGVRAEPALLEEDIRWQIEADAIAAEIRQAMDRHDRLLTDGRPHEARAPLVDALERLEDFLDRTPSDHPQHQRAAHDRVALLRELERMPEAVAAWEALPPAASRPPFARRAAADAYLAERRPEAALPLYESLLPADRPADLPLLIALYYTHIALEDYDAAGDILARADRETPAWLPAGEGREPVANWERVDVDQLLVHDAAYRRQDANAWRSSGDLVEQAPAHAGLRNTRARIARWRGWPERADAITSIAAAWAPEALDTRLNRAANARDLEHFDAWEEELERLTTDFPRDASVRRQVEELADRDRASIESEVTVGRTRGGAGAISGDRDRSWRTRLNSPWSDRDLRAFVEHRRETATFDDTEGRHDRIGAGVEWAAHRQRAWLRVDRNRLGEAETGIAAGWSQWLDDHWRIGIEADSHSLETPLRAAEAGLTGWSAAASLDWRASESLSAYATTGLLSIDDGNRRVQAGTGVTRRLFASAHHLTEAGADLYAQHNSEPGGPYYNPENSGSATVRLDHDWITWRRYERAFTQHFHAASGLGYQTDFGSHPIVELRYEHRWDINRRWAVRYGVGWTSTAYDGERERRLYGTFGLEGVF
ncbi:poly-beta-1,6 N-acetyl-D-glucosamine export porin PgaA [Guyparkeria sp.]|uniref:poly-beta-1,6 N-acetyl-D-glucosamine export porin PgaA n=1 Tax=Guyparkeria sp. TaxID=2035736 RepID=UPI0035622CD3